MAILKRRIALYRVRCDICGAWSQEDEDREQALLQADGEGFRFYIRWQGQELIQGHLCEGCWSEGIWVKDGKYGDMEPIQPEELERLLREQGR